MNTKHEQDSSKSKNAKTALEIKDNVNSVKKNACQTKLYCDDCNFCSINKKTLKKHIDKCLHN